MSKCAKTTIASLSREVLTEADAYRLLETLRWGETPRCPFCAGSDAYLIVPTNGLSRRTAAGTMSERRVWKCRPCRKQFSVLTGTIMHATKIPVRTWVLVLFDMCCAKNGISAREVERRYGVTIKTAWHMLHRIRQAMAGGDRLMTTMRGTVEADETWIGGSVRNRHASDPRGRRDDKVPVLALVNENTGEVRSKVVPDVTGFTLRKAMSDLGADLPNIRLHTDGAKAYEFINYEFASHHAVNHEAGRYVDYKTGATTNCAENFFSQLKRSLDGTHHHVSRQHLHRYLGEFDFRYSTCKMSDWGRMRTLGKQMEGRLSYKRIRTSRTPVGQA